MVSLQFKFRSTKGLQNDVQNLFAIRIERRQFVWVDASPMPVYPFQFSRVNERVFSPKFRGDTLSDISFYSLPRLLDDRVPSSFILKGKQNE